jgi:hypothetical protein
MTFDYKINSMLADALIVPYNEAASTMSIPAALTSTLGCATCLWSIKAGFKEYRTRQPAKAHEPTVVNTLVTLARFSHREKAPSHISSLAILEGFTRNNRWRSCTTSNSDAQALAHLLVAVAARIHVQKRFAKVALETQWWCVAEPVVCSLLNAWLNPDIKYVESPTLEALAPLLFGEDWARMVAAIADGEVTEGLIATLRPPVQFKLLSGPQTPDTSVLPDLECVASV